MCGHSATLVENYMIIIGGINSTTINNFVLQYDITSNEWESLETYGGAKPTSKNMHYIINYSYYLKNFLYTIL